MAYDLPDDWGMYYRTCSLCGERYHASGVVECACISCADCGELVPPVDADPDEDGEVRCPSCQKARDEESDEDEQPEED